MLSPRDRLLALLFGIQLLAAGVFGAVLVNKLGDAPTTTVVTQDGAGPGAVPTAVPSGGVTPAPGSTPTSRTVTSVTGGSAGSTTGGGGGTGSKPVPPGAPIKIGVLVTQTGAINFAPSAQGTKAYVDRINARGGVNGHKIELTIMDDQLDQARGQQAAQRMLADGVLAFAAWNAPNTENQIVPFLERNKIPLIGSFGEYPEYHSKYAYAFTASYGHYGYEMARYLKQMGATKPALVYIDNGEQHANDGLEAAAAAGWKSAGGTGTFEVHREEPTQGVYDDAVTSMQVNGVDGLVTILDQTAYNRLQQASDRHGFRPKHVADPLFADPAVKKTSTNEGTIVATDVEFLESETPETKDYVDTVRAKYGADAPVNWVGQVGWLDAKILVAALEKLGNDITREGLITAIDTMKPTGFGLTSPMQFGPGVRDLNRCLKMGKVTGGKVVPTTGWLCDGQPF
ncbi:MAG TPA: ABC transporter substrate-binding protein [Mycobacteriales bacterium]|nr:ABC transporter substrate-binding protein [Mycobacteriales bacterium]